MKNKEKVNEVIITKYREFKNKNKNKNKHITENTTMKRYDDYKNNKNEIYLTKEEIKSIDFTKYKIIVPTEKDKKELMEAFEEFHNSNIDTDYITVNQLSHEYLNEERAEGTSNNIIVDAELYSQIENKRG